MEDELHFFMTCPVYSVLRENFIDIYMYVISYLFYKAMINNFSNYLLIPNTHNLGVHLFFTFGRVLDLVRDSPEALCCVL